MSSPQSVSVIMPAYNAAATIAESLRTIRAQNHPRLETIVVDDGSTDDTVAVVRRECPDARIFVQENAGPAVARNRAIRESGGELLAFLDADDLWPDDKLARQLPWLEPGSEFDLAVGQMRKFTGSAAEGYDFDGEAFLFVLGCGLYRRELFDRIGTFDESLPGGYSEDTDWFMRAWEAKCRIKFQPEVTIHYRRHEGSMTHGLDCSNNGFLLAVRNSIRRRRSQEGGVVPMPKLYLEPEAER